ncbi:MAG TPA: hypothetical protein VH165_17780 [Kofleriaceae bacterium]|jgi:hypothetical protein|nr:hypothetical protein [Kofleriaceae bacterium]
MSWVSQLRAAARRGGRAVRDASPRTILLIGFAVFVMYAFPGYMSNDSCDQLLDARGHAFSDAHPPVMAAEWLILDAIIAGPILMLLVQGVLFLGGLHGVLRRVMAPRAAALTAVLVLLFPPVLTTMAVIWKDSQMAAYLVAGAALLLSPRRGIRVLGLGVTALGCAFRHNAFAAAVPLIGLLFVWRPGARWWKRYLISSAAGLLVFGGASGLNTVLTVHHVAVVDSLALADIAGVLNYTRDRSDDDLREVLRGVPISEQTHIQAHTRELFSPRSAMALFYGDRPVFALPQPQHHEAIVRAWRELVFGDPRAYFAYRGTGFQELLGMSDTDLWLPVWGQFLGYPELRTLVHHNAALSEFQSAALPAMLWTAFDIALFRPYIYALLALLLLVTCCRDRLSLGLLGSGLLYELSFFPAANTVDFRYSHWMIACTCLATVVLFGQRWRAGRAEIAAVAPEAG